MSWRLLPVWLVAGLCVSSSAAGHAPPRATGIQWFTSGGAERAVVRTNRGLLIEEPSGGLFRIVCNDAFDTSLVEVPPLVVAADGRLLLGTYASGLLISSPDGCSFDPAAGAFDGFYPIDVKADAQGVVYAAALPLDGSSAELLVSSDQGQNGMSLTSLPGAPTALELAPSDSSRLYVSTTATEGELSFGYLLASTDAGRSFEEHPIELDASELRVFLLAVAAHDPRLSFVRTQSRDGITAERLLRSEDGGETFETVLSVPGPISLVVSGERAVWAGAADGLYRSNDAGRSFERIEAFDLTRVTCLVARGDALYACGYSAGEFGVLVSMDGNARFEWFLRFPEVRARLDCPADSDEGTSCEAAFADWAFEQGLAPTEPVGEAGASAEPTSPPARRAEAGCQFPAGGSAPLGPALLGVVLGLAAACRFRRRSAPAALSDER
jgi:hypothetical protein